jgi:hypothetical protein
MHVIEMLLPLYDRDGRRFGPEPYDEVRGEMLVHFGGVTAFTRTPAEGLWSAEGTAEKDEIVFFEVMVEEFDRGWWHAYRRKLEVRFQQEEIVVRAQAAERI